MNDCPLCGRVDLSGSGDPPKSDFDRVVLRGPHAVLVPTIGMLVPGYLMAVTTRHVTSFGALGSNALAEVVTPWITAAVENLGRSFGDYLLFEHGAGDAGEARGGCVVHAHIHLIPGDQSLADAVLGGGDWAEISGLADIAAHAPTGYAFLARGGQAWYIARPSFPGQWIRRCVADWVGRPDEWDWGVFPHRENLAPTLKALATPRHSDCSFCALGATQNDSVFAVDDLHPLVPGHQLVIPRRHVTRLEELPAAEWGDLFGAVHNAMLRCREQGYDGLNVGVNSGVVAGQTVEHSHLHLIPRVRGDVPDPRGGIRWMFGDRAPYWD